MMPSHPFRLAAAACLGVLAWIPAFAAPNAPEQNLKFANGIVAIAEEKAITVDDVRREIAPLIPQLQREAKNEEDFNQKLEALQDDVIQNQIDRVLIVKDFYKEKDGEGKKTIPASYVDNQLAETIITQYDNDRSKFLADLRRQGKTIRDYRREIEEDIIYNYMRSQQRKSQSIISPVKVATFYNENKEKFYQDDQVHLRLIQFNRTATETDATLRAKCENVLARLKAGETFADIAKEVSQDTRKSRGGDWGWLKKADLKPELSEPLFGLKKNEVTSPILMNEGAFLLFVEDRKYSGIQSLDEVRDDIENILVQQMARASQERWLERLRRNGYVKHY
ncbi:peptidyl-prolyl cis-trans isomerase [Nibricoccus sp. IMCC34717]|uniref:peptidylprolyl isomerase n=1 Tax=Nibricoccus sp. IMCC34717 TaxID=3034021 RepID=UPI0038511735